MLNNWISITDELPTVYMPILLWIGPGDSDHCGCTVGYIDCTNISQDTQYIKIQTQWYDILGNRIYDIVAWQPLPFGPNGEAVVSPALIGDRADNGIDRRIETLQRWADARQSV